MVFHSFVIVGFRDLGASLIDQMVKNLSAIQETRDTGLIPWSGRSPGGGHGNPLWYSCQENPIDRETWWLTVHGGHKESDTTEVIEPACRLELLRSRVIFILK